MWIGIVVMLWPYEWKVMSSNLGRQEFTFIFANFSLEWMWKGGGKPSRRGGLAVLIVELWKEHKWEVRVLRVQGLNWERGEAKLGWTKELSFFSILIKFLG